MSTLNKMNSNTSLFISARSALGWKRVYIFFSASIRWSRWKGAIKKKRSLRWKCDYTPHPFCGGFYLCFLFYFYYYCCYYYCYLSELFHMSPPWGSMSSARSGYQLAFINAPLLLSFMRCEHLLYLQPSAAAEKNKNKI